MNETTLSIMRFPRIWSAWFIIDALLLGWAGPAHRALFVF